MKDEIPLRLSRADGGWIADRLRLLKGEICERKMVGVSGAQEASFRSREMRAMRS